MAPYKKTQTKKGNPLQISDISNITNTSAILQYYDMVKSEYEIERNKKQSFENRAGLILALLGATCLFMFEKVNLPNTFSLMSKCVTFFTIVKIVSGLCVYVCFAITIIAIFKTIGIKKHNNLNVQSIDESLIGEAQISALPRIIFAYREIILQHRELNEKRATFFKHSLYGISGVLISIIIHINISL